MRLHTGPSVILIVCVSSLAAAASWGFNEGTISVQTKGVGADNAVKEKFAEKSPVKNTIQLGPSDNLKVLLTTQEAKTAKRAHQAFLSIVDGASGLETSFPFSVKDSGKAKLELTHKEIPSQLIASEEPLTASVVIASFGSSIPYKSTAFKLSIVQDPNNPAAKAEKALRYGKLPEIHHIFKKDAKSPPKVISLFFTAIVLAALPALLGSWLFLGANVNHINKALGNAPISHALFFGSIIAMEGIFYMYYTVWNLAMTLPAASAVGLVIFLSGSRALTEVQERRLAGLR